MSADPVTTAGARELLSQDLRKRGYLIHWLSVNTILPREEISLSIQANATFSTRFLLRFQIPDRDRDLVYDSGCHAVRGAT